MSPSAREAIRFLRAFLRAPGKVGSVVPSSSHAAEAMLRPIDFGRAEVVVELGAGTGVFTNKIAERLAPGARGVVFERDAVLRPRLARAFPALEVHPDAEALTELVGAGQADAVVCALPLANFPGELRARLIDAMHHVLRPGGKLTVIQYSPQARGALRRRFADVSVAFVPLNVPPALVYTCTT